MYKLKVSGTSFKLFEVKPTEQMKHILLLAGSDPAFSGPYTNYLVESPQDSGIGSRTTPVLVGPTYLSSFRTDIFRHDKDNRNFDYLYHDGWRFLKQSSEVIGGTLKGEVSFRGTQLTKIDGTTDFARPTIVAFISSDELNSDGGSSPTIEYKPLYAFDIKTSLTSPNDEGGLNYSQGMIITIYKWFYNEDGSFKERPALFSKTITLPEGASERHPFKLAASGIPQPFSFSYQYNKDTQKAYFACTCGAEGDEQIIQTFIEEAESSAYTTATRFGIGSWQSEYDFRDISIGNPTAQSTIDSIKAAAEKAKTDAEQAALKAKEEEAKRKAAEEEAARKKAEEDAARIIAERGEIVEQNDVIWMSDQSFTQEDSALVSGELGLLEGANETSLIDIHLGNADQASLYHLSFNPSENTVDLHRYDQFSPEVSSVVATASADMSTWYKGTQRLAFSLIVQNGTFTLKVGDAQTLLFNDPQPRTGISEIGIASWGSHIYRSGKTVIDTNPHVITTTDDSPIRWRNEHRLTGSSGLITSTIENKTVQESDPTYCTSIIYLSSDDAIEQSNDSLYSIVLTYITGSELPEPVVTAYVDKRNPNNRAKGTTRSEKS